ncbi:MAG: aminopeptidase [Flavobacteriia bacterium]|nr:aminopeptidase [Flavobacteriia bacterium]
MKKILLSTIILASAFSFSQNIIKNAENSEYTFTKIAHLDATPVQSQGNTGTCWSFSALSFFESELIRKGIKNPPTLSEMYIVRKAYEDKADKYIRMDGKTNFSEGGAFHDIPYVIKNYGIVPNDVYLGMQKDQQEYDHSEMFSIMNGAMDGLLKHMKESGSKGISLIWKDALNGILDTYIGKDIKEFDYNGKKFTPKSYAQSLSLNMNEYVSLTSFTNHEMYQPCFLAIQDNWSWGTSYNVGLDDLMLTIENALKSGYTIAWGADVSEKGFSFRNGIAIVPEDPSTIEMRGKDNKNFSNAGAEKSSNAFLTPVKELKITPEIRQKAYDNKTTTDDHGMHITGLYKDQKGTRFLLVKNSWGTENYPEGYLYVSEHYFNWKTINIYLHKEGIPQDLRKKLNL